MMQKREVKEMACNGNCASCGGCARELTVTAWEVEMLQKLGQIPFLPVARKMGDLNPVYLEDGDHSVEEYGLILQCLEKKGLISLDFGSKIKGFDDSAYASYPIRGSMALTQRGQQVLEMIELQGIREEN
jgi:hypothetical protein